MTSKFLFEISRENGVGLFTWVVVVVTEDTVVVVDVVVMFVVVAVELVSDGQVDGQKPYSPSMWVPALKLGVMSYPVMGDYVYCARFILFCRYCKQLIPNLVVEVEHQGAACPTEVQAL